MPDFPATRTRDVIYAADVAVIGGGLGGIAAALAAAEGGASVVLTSEEAMIGGQVTAQLTAPLDEHPLVETVGVTARYRRFRNLVRAGGLDNPGGGWVSRLCFEPLVGLRVLEEMLQPHVDAGRIRIVRAARPVSVTDVDGHPCHSGSVIGTVRLRVPTGAHVLVRAAVFADATELGDLLPLTGTGWTIGSEGADAFGEPDAVPGGADPRAEQSCTWAAILVRETEPQPVGDAPPGYSTLRDEQPFSLDLPDGSGGLARYRFFTAEPGGLAPFWEYRRIRRASTAVAGVTSADAASTPAKSVQEAAVINWSGNDYRASGLVGEPKGSAAGARALTLAFVHWLRTEAPRDPGDWPGPFGTGFGYPELRLAPELSGTDDGLAAAPYVRESRRLANPRPITAAALAPVSPGAPAAEIGDSVGIAWYHTDLHPRVGHTRDVYRPTGPFQIPAHALVPAEGVGPANLVMGAKNLAATQVAAAAYRVHPAEWAIGEAAGVLAAHSVAHSVDLRGIVDDPAALAEVQQQLLNGGSPLSWRSAAPYLSQHALPQTEIRNA